MLRKILIALGVVVLVVVLVVGGGGYLFIRRSFPTINGTIRVPGLQSEVRIYRDRWGVPNIYADNLHDLFFAQGYVHAQDRLWQMEFNRRVGSGTLSEVLGEATLEDDKFLRTIGLRRAAEKDWESLDENTRAALQAYADGVNAFIESHKDRLPLEFVILGATQVPGYIPAPWTPVDSLAWGKVMCWDLGANWRDELKWARFIQELGEETTRELMPAYPEAGPFIIPPEAKDYRDLGITDLFPDEHLARILGNDGEGLGSNNWVVDGTMTASGKPLLANDPHLSLQTPSIWYEIGLHAPGFDVVGASFPGTPAVIIGHNERITWGVTNVGPDVQDLYLEKVNPDNPYQVEYMGQWEDVKVVDEEIRVAGQDKPISLEVRITRHGPIINDVVEGLAQPTAFRWTALEGQQLFRAVLLIDQADNWQEFRDALRYWDAPSQNFVYADVEGNIGYQMPGHIPIRAQGQGLVPVPGWTGEYEWTGYIPFDELPSVFNPPTHFVVTANNEVVPDDYPYFIAYGWAAPYRAQRITELLSAANPGSLTVDDMRDVQADVYSISAEKLMPYLVALEPEGWLQERVMRDLLRPWDYYLSADSAAASVFEVFYWKLVEHTFQDELGELYPTYLEMGNYHRLLLERLVEEPDNHWWDDVSTDARETRDDIYRAAFADALEYLGRHYGDLHTLWRWDKMHSAHFDHPLGAVKPLDRIFNVSGVPVGGDNFTVNPGSFKYKDPFSVDKGPSYRQIVDLSDWNNSRSMHTTGQSGQPFHKHFSDMIESWRKVEHHPMLFDRAQIEQNREGLLVLVP